MASFLTVSEGNDTQEFLEKQVEKNIVRFECALHPPWNSVQISILLENVKKLLR